MGWLYGGDWSASRQPCDTGEMARQLMYAIDERIDLVGKDLIRTWGVFIQNYGIVIIPEKPEPDDVHFLPSNFLVNAFFTSRLYNIISVSGNYKYKATGFWRWPLEPPYEEDVYKFIGSTATSVDFSSEWPGPYSYYDHQESLADYFTPEDGTLVNREYFAADPTPLAKMKDWLETYRYLHTAGASLVTTVTDISGSLTYG